MTVETLSPELDQLAVLGEYLEDFEELKLYATPDEINNLTILLERTIALQSPLDYACYVTPGTQRYDYVEVLNEYITALCEYRLYKSGPGPEAKWYRKYSNGVIEEVPFIFDVNKNYSKENGQVVDWWGENPNTGEKVILRLAIILPPRHGKSYLITQHTPSWYVSRWPNRPVAVCTYSDDFAWEWGEGTRELINNNSFLTLRGNSRARLRFVGYKGEIRFAGVGGKLTGTGNVFGIIDDAFKNAEEAGSEATRNGKDNWYGSTFKTRKEPFAVEAMMGTRWHEDEIIGRRCYDDDGKPRDDWVVLRLPAIAEEYDEDDPDSEPDLLNREPGEALCPERFTVDQLEKFKEEDPIWFDSLYQGVPNLGSSGLFGDGFTYYRDTIDGYERHMGQGDSDHTYIPINSCRRFITVDLAISKKNWADFTVFGCWDFSKTHNTLILVDIYREKITGPNHMPELEDFASRNSCTFIAVEKKTYGIDLIQRLRRESKYTVFELEADQDKYSRAIPAAQRNKSGRLWIPLHGLWVTKYKKELSAFHRGRFDDQVDVTAYADILVKMYGTLGDITKPKVPETLEEEVAEHADRLYRLRRSTTSIFKRLTY